MIGDDIATCCRTLRLSRNIPDIFGSVEADTHQEYLLKLLKSELEHREILRRERLIKNAGFYTIKSFEDFRFDDVTLPAAITPEYLKSCGFLEKKNNIVMFGNVGTGKTHLSIALGLEACNMGKDVRFFRTSSLVNRLAESKKAGTLSALMKQFSKLDMLICDEWGYVPLDRQGAQLLFEVVSECYEKRSIVITTNIEFSRWVTVFYDEQMTGAIIDRILHHCHLLLFPGPSVRLQESMIRQ